MRNVQTFIATHREIPFNISFPYTAVCLDEYKKNGAIIASQHLPEYMANDRTFASYRAGWAVVNLLQNQTFKNDFIAIYSYRSFFGTNFDTDFHKLTTENYSVADEQSSFRIFRSPQQLKLTWRKDIISEVPHGFELVITKPVAFQISFAEQYSSSHHFDDLMYGLGLAIRVGCISAEVAAHVLSNKIFIHGFIARRSFWIELYNKLFLIADKFYKNYYVKRVGYQERNINFVLERIVSIYLIQKAYYENIPTISTNIVQISEDGVYQKGY